ncbi:uncharacterized protein UTRI_10617_B [Ustilago trichophora]|uniref:Transmembrane protein n=1 Tax=Ustilago trichophora TaxID=86804 RepID=A0A5C3EAS9_9BASI|nr:uncharacterized protein UTRI_10617_B [Ustilago trichophora]
MMFSQSSSLRRRGPISLLTTLLVLALVTLSFAIDSTPLARRDAFTSVRGTVGDKSLTTLGKRPPGAYARSLPVSLTSSIFTWYSKTPNDETQAESAFIILHGVNRNAGVYWTILNNAWAKARDAGLGSAAVNSIRVAPLFFSTIEDQGVYEANELAWGDSNAWTAGEASTHPRGSGISSFAVLDSLLNRFGNKGAYPKMKYITFVAHGGGAQMLQRYAVMGAPNPDPSRLSVRYVVGDPSSELYFTQDRPVGVDQSSCPLWDDYRYGTKKYSANYGVLNAARAPALFKAYAAKEVRYVVGLNDTKTEKGDQTCMAHAVGGDRRRNRSLAYWKYIHLLSGTTNPDSLKNFPGTFPALDPKDGKTTQRNIPRSSSAVVSKFKGAQIRHSLTVVDGAGHSASKVYMSAGGRNALFADQASSGSGTIPDYSQQLVGYTADAAGAKNYDDGGEDV